MVPSGEGTNTLRASLPITPVAFTCTDLSPLALQGGGGGRRA